MLNYAPDAVVRLDLAITLLVSRTVAWVAVSLWMITWWKCTATKIPSSPLSDAYACIQATAYREITQELTSPALPLLELVLQLPLQQSREAKLSTCATDRISSSVCLQYSSRRLEVRNNHQLRHSFSSNQLTISQSG